MIQISIRANADDSPGKWTRPGSATSRMAPGPKISVPVPECRAAAVAGVARMVPDGEDHMVSAVHMAVDRGVPVAAEGRGAAIFVRPSCCCSTKSPVMAMA